jgi:hypothetical protein
MLSERANFIRRKPPQSLFEQLTFGIHFTAGVAMDRFNNVPKVVEGHCVSGGLKTEDKVIAKTFCRWLKSNMGVGKAPSPLRFAGALHSGLEFIVGVQALKHTE